ncbi:hypothetical protein [Litorihabitans aurantiacus]|uniref:DUF4157 domain-containing protein n=1 Tax=Litorihabitans aurantiacus TaxID=1930061 RepID=A0AA37ULY3_9MICO|nr:hypothetical protein [Litorihabitans aurantiacus]GMA30880.1 hypothetical protein GCM10025875_08720 [Litorihabitans aurantiacus]
MAAIVVAALAVVAVLIGTFLVRAVGTDAADPTEPPTGPTSPPTAAPTTDPPPATTEPPSTPTTTEPPPPPPPTAEEVFRSGGWEQPLPDPVPLGAPIPAFDDEYRNPQDWLAKDGVTGITVIPTDDPSLNCGLNHPDAGTWTVAGCYSTSHRDVIFVWWNSDSVRSERAFLVAHEYSHWIQWNNHFDVMHAASQQGFNENPAWYEATESDASCRLLSWGGYDEAIVANSSSPCTTDGWYEGWLEDAGRSLGIQF